MSDESAAVIRAERRDWTTQHLATYLRSGGTRGHIVDTSSAGGHRLTTHCLIRCQGRRSGQLRVKPLIYGVIGGEVVIVASRGGADNHPEWYLNICESSTVDVQIGTQAFRATWREPRAAQRERVWDFVVGLYPPYAGYQASTDREIPLVLLSPGEPIDVFTLGATGPA
jgi:deazaflavin-dependent oxidoreductase (nitroreductase family)